MMFELKKRTEAQRRQYLSGLRTGIAESRQVGLLFYNFTGLDNAE
jgi:hypothetical protein